MNKKRQLITIDEAVEAKGQHEKPCSDCPFARASLPGWLGGESVAVWLAEAHGNMDIPCHTLKGAQCAGSAIYRTNVLKRNVADGVLLLPADRELVFATPTEFAAHHNRGPRGSAPQTQGVKGTPPTEATVMPKADVIAKNMALGNLKAKHDEKMAKVAAAHAKVLLRKEEAAKKAVAKTKGDFQKVDDLTSKLAAVNQQPLNSTTVAIDKRRGQISGLVAKIRAITDKYLLVPTTPPVA